MFKRNTVLGALATLFLGLPASGLAADAVTFTKDVAPILHKSCVECHRPSMFAPMSLLTYDEARPYARSIKQRVVSRVMPPWGADPAHGTFKNDPRLSQAEIPLNLPAGWEFDKVFGPQGDAPSDPSLTPIERRADLTEAEKAQRVTYAAVAQNRGAQPAPPPATGATLPKGATDAEIRIFLGILLCLVSLFLLVVRRRHLVPAVRHGR